VDIMPPDAQSYETIFGGGNLCLIAENSGGELTVHAIGKKPLEDIVVKAAVTAVKGANGRIVGAAVGNISTGGDSPSCPVSSVNGKTGAVMLEAADVGARSSDWMPTAQEVGADSKGAAKTAVFEHDASTDSHGDIRLELKAIADRLTAFFDSDNQTLDELSEIVAYITDNKELIDSITTSKVSVVDVINNLTTNVVNKPLSAAQGVVLRGLITELGASLSNYQPKGNYAHTSDIPTKVSQLQNDSGYLTEHQDISGKLDATKLPEAINKALEQAKESGEFDGANGKSAYEAAVYNGFEGTEKEWLASLKGEDYVLTDADKAEIVRMVIESLGGNPIFGYVDENNNIIVSGNLADGSYSVKYEMEDGSTVDIGNLVLDTNVYYSVTNNLTNCTSDNGASKVVEGESYIATITANDGYELKSVSATMGGSAVSVSGGVINIASVTGNIVITAVAEEKQAAEPVTVDIALTDGIRIGSDGGDRTQTGYCATPHIDLTNIPKPCTIHLTKAKWLVFDGESNTMIRVYAKKTDGAQLISNVTKQGNSGSYFTIVDNSGGIGNDVTVTVVSDAVGYIRFSGSWTGYGISDSTDSFAEANTKATLTYTPVA
jgi:hypothetical protein